MLVLITGNPNVGKTTLINKLKADGYTTIAIDDYIKEIYKVNQIGYILISTHFGKEYVNSKCVDTRLLGNLVLNDEYQMVKLKSLIWPLIKSKLYVLKKQDKNIIVEMAIFKIDPLYFYNIFDYVIDIRKDKVFNNYKEKYKKWYQNHLCFNPNIIIDNNGEIDDAYEVLKDIISKLKITPNEIEFDKIIN